MKKTLLLFSAAFLTFFSSCDLSKCNITLPDLLHIGADFGMTIMNENSSSITYDIVGNFLNAAEILTGKCECSKSTNISGEHKVNWRIYTSDDGISVKDLIKDEVLNKSQLLACATDATGIEIEFLKSGFYIIANFLDFQDMVKERNEFNNDMDNQWGSKPLNAHHMFENEKIKFGNNLKYSVIYIDVDNSKIEYKDGEEVVVKINSVY